MLRKFPHGQAKFMVGFEHHANNFLYSITLVLPSLTRLEMILKVVIHWPGVQKPIFAGPKKWSYKKRTVHTPILRLTFVP